MNAALRTTDLAVGYRARRARRAVLERLNVAVNVGELVCLIGPNGIGKSTLLRTLANMQPPLWGSVALSGDDLASLSPREVARRVGVVLTDRVWVEALTVRQIVELGRYPHSGWLGRLNAEDHRAVSWAIDIVGARHLAERDFHRLSDGERQRVMVARALAQEPSVLMLDEPTAFLDVPSRVELMGLLRDLTHNGPIAVLMSTHDLELALRTADRLWLLVPGGELIAGAPEDVVLSGAIAQAFEGRQIRFHAAARSFRWLTDDGGSAVVRGVGLRAAMAVAVLERQGYTVSEPISHAGALCIETNETGWRASADEGEHHGADFASLATFLRQRRSST
jgi:iron complex transport system ATP-binding protein